jgi:hypothetical protein
VSPADIKKKIAALKKITTKPIHVISGVARTGVTEVLHLIADKIKRPA